VEGGRERGSSYIKHAGLNNLRMDFVGNNGVDKKQSWVSQVSDPTPLLVQVHPGSVSSE